MSANIWRIIARVNKWRLDPHMINEDKHIEKYEASTVKWDPNVFSLDDIVEGVYTLRGPRQVGKTTTLKLLIKKLLEAGFPPQSIVYLPCDILEKHTQLLGLLIDIRERTKGRLVMILDEVTFVDEWQRAVKIFVDEGLLKDTTIIACGSHAIDVKKGSSYLVGRRGNARHPIDRIMLTMSFREYVSILEPELLKGVASLEDIIHMDPLKREILIERLYYLFMNYLRTGGFPRVIDEYNKLGKIKDETINDFTNYLARDITRIGRSESIARALISAIIKQKCNPTSWNSLAREIGVSQPTVQDYIETLLGMYIIRPIYHPNRNFTNRDERKDKKLIFRDPFLYHIGSIWAVGFPEIDIKPEEIITRNLEENTQHIVEMIVLEHLARQHNKIYYWKTKREIDAITIKEKEVVGMEVKWRDKITRNTIREAIRTYSKIPLKRKPLIIITKNTYEKQENTILIPAPLYLITTN